MPKSKAPAKRGRPKRHKGRFVKRVSKDAPIRDWRLADVNEWPRDALKRFVKRTDVVRLPEGYRRKAHDPFSGGKLDHTLYESYDFYHVYVSYNECGDVVLTVYRYLRRYKRFKLLRTMPPKHSEIAADKNMRAYVHYERRSDGIMQAAIFSYE